MRNASTVNTPELMAEVGCSYRQIDYWVRLGLVATTGPAEPGSGRQRRFDRHAVFVAKIVNVLTGFGFYGTPLQSAVRNFKAHSLAARLVYVKEDGSTDWQPGAVAAIVIDLDQLRLKSDRVTADRSA